MATPKNSRKLECHGPCDEYGDELPDGVARVGLFYRSNKNRAHIVLDYSEAIMLRAELEGAIQKINRNRATRFGGVLSE